MLVVMVMVSHDGGYGGGYGDCCGFGGDDGGDGVGNDGDGTATTEQAETRKWEGSPLITREGGSSSGLLSLKDRKECRWAAGGWSQRLDEND